MPKIKIDDLKGIKEKLKDIIELREGKLYSPGEKRPYKINLMVCCGTGCVSGGSFGIKAALEHELKEKGLQCDVSVTKTGCNGFCEMGPLMVVQPDGIFYVSLKEDDIPYLVEEHFLNGRPVEKFMYTTSGEKFTIPKMKDIRFFSKQVLITMSNRSMIDPENIEEYIARDGYSALAKCLTQMKPEQIIEEIKKSGLRGRGGAGFPTGVKWEAVRNANSSTKSLIANCDEGDPGAFMDRNLVEANPHSILEGMLIGAIAVSASEGYFYIRNEYPLAVERIKIAINQAYDYGILGKGILGMDFNFDLKVIRGAGAFVCGEETALIAAIEGRVGEPRQRPPFPAQKGLWGKPTCINNVETWATIPYIINKGANWFSSIGTETSKGTKIFSLVGKVSNTGLIEVPMGISLKEIIYDIGGGIHEGKKFKAIQTGGPSGGCIPTQLIDLPVDYESLTNAGSIMGSGGMVVMDENTCMVDIARYFLNFISIESCGICTPCREGIGQMLVILDKITKGGGRIDDLIILEDLALIIQETSLCGLGKTAPNPIISTIRYFRDEYKAHIEEKRCPAGVCRELIKYYIDAEKCTGCGRCIKACPQRAITGEKREPHLIMVEECIKCGACLEVCKFSAVVIQ